MRNAPQLPNNFRLPIKVAKPYIDWDGFSNMKIAGSGQFSKLALEKVFSYLKTKEIIVVDLRQESHGFLNGNAISWYGIKNAANAKLSDLEIQSQEDVMLKDLNREETVTTYRILTKNVSGEPHDTKPVEFAFHTVSSEEDLLKGMNIEYYRIYTQDYHPPSPSQVDDFLKIVALQKQKNKWLYFHCRAGIGRTSLFMVMYDMLLNAKKIEFKDILARQAAIGGKDLRSLPSRDNFKYRAHYERLKFLEQFYQYAQQNKDNFKTNWSAWLKQQSKIK